MTSTHEGDSPTARALQAVMDDARRPLEKRIAELEAELAEREDAIPARITAEMERDELATKLASALQTVTALGQTIRAIPDAMANDAANLAHARAERDRLRQEIVDARGETVAEAIRADMAEAQRDEARTELQRFTNPTPEQVRELEVAADRDEAAYWDAAREWEQRKRAERPLTPGLPGYACGICGSLFTPAGEPRDEHSRTGSSAYCQGCVDRCHEGSDGHRCVICTTDKETP